MMIDQLIAAQAGVVPGAIPGNDTGQIGAGGTPTNPAGTNPDGAPAGVVNGQ
jgi:hypothetical protein